MALEDAGSRTTGMHAAAYIGKRRATFSSSFQRAPPRLALRFGRPATDRPGNREVLIPNFTAARHGGTERMGKWAVVLAVAGMLSFERTLQAQDGYKIIVNAANPIWSVSKTQVLRFFLERATWDDGQPASAVDLPPASPTRELFSRDVLGMPIPAVISRWRSVSGSGSGDPPPSMATDREVLAYVRLKPGAIGYVSAGTETQGVKVIAVGKDIGSSSQGPIEVGGMVPMPERIEGAQPEYPPAAKSARLEGQVDIELIIGVSGYVDRARIVVRSAPSLDEAAIAAVKRWKYRPTLINGVPVPVKTRVRISFTL